MGSSLVKKLLKSNNDIIVYDNDFRGDLENFQIIQKKLKLIKGDIRDLKNLRSIINKCNRIYHLSC